MNISMINENTIRCILTDEDMRENDLHLEDFFDNREKTQELLEMIMEQAHEEFGYESKSGMVAMQIVPLPKNSLSIILTDDPEKSFLNMLKAVRDMKPGNIGLPGIEDVSADVPGSGQQCKELPKLGTEIYRFESLDDVCEMARVVNAEKLKSRLIKGSDGKFYFTADKGRLSAKNFVTYCAKIGEFGERVTLFTDISHLEEHSEVLIKKKAAAVLAKL